MLKAVTRAACIGAVWVFGIGVMAAIGVCAMVGASVIFRVVMEAHGG